MTPTDTAELERLDDILRDPLSGLTWDNRIMAADAIREVLARRKAEAWQPIETAPRDGSDLLVWYDHDADPYQDPENPGKLTSYAAWADGGDFLAGKGMCVARWFAQHWESTGDYGEGYYLPAAWFAAENNDYERVVNALYWTPLPTTPTTPEAEGGCDAE